MIENITQVGQVDEFYKIYVEDYVHSFLKKLQKEAKKNPIKLNLYGQKKITDRNSFFYIYGATVKTIQTTKEDKLTKQQYFKDHDLLATLEIKDTEKELKFPNGNILILKGYYVFYDENVQMQQYLIDYYEPHRVTSITRRHTETQQKLASTTQAHHYTATQQKPTPTTQDFLFLYTVTYAAAIVMCVLAITAVNSYDKMKGFNDQVIEKSMQVSQYDETNSHP